MNIEKDMAHIESDHHRLFGKPPATKSLAKRIRLKGLSVAFAILAIINTACTNPETKKLENELKQISQIQMNNVSEKDSLRIAVQVEKLVEAKLIKKIHEDELKLMKKPSDYVKIIEQLKRRIYYLEGIIREEGNPPDSVHHINALKNDLRHLEISNNHGKITPHTIKKNQTQLLNPIQRKKISMKLPHFMGKKSGIYYFQGHILLFEKLPYRINIDRNLRRSDYLDKARNIFLKSSYANSKDKHHAKIEYVFGIKRDSIFLVVYELTHQQNDINNLPNF